LIFVQVSRGEYQDDSIKKQDISIKY